VLKIIGLAWSRLTFNGLIVLRPEKIVIIYDDRMIFSSKD